jgi:hypothetical protein
VQVFYLQNEEDRYCFAVLDCIVPHLYDLTHIAPRKAGYCVAEVLKEKQQDFRQDSTSFPGLDTVCLYVTGRSGEF